MTHEPCWVEWMRDVSKIEWRSAHARPVPSLTRATRLRAAKESQQDPLPSARAKFLLLSKWLRARARIVGNPVGTGFRSRAPITHTLDIVISLAGAPRRGGVGFERAQRVVGGRCQR